MTQENQKISGIEPEKGAPTPNEAEELRRAENEAKGVYDEKKEEAKADETPALSSEPSEDGVDRAAEEELQKDILQNWKMTLTILTAASVLMSLSYTMLIPFLPMYLLDELKVAQEDVNLWSGLVFSISFLISGVMAPIWGAMADKKSKKLMAVRAAVLLAASCRTSGSFLPFAPSRDLRPASGQRASRSFLLRCLRTSSAFHSAPCSPA